MKIFSKRSICVSLASLALVFSMAGCARTNTETTSEYRPTGQSEVREMTEQGKAGLQQAAQKAEQGLEKIAASSNDAMKNLGVKSGYGPQEEQEFLTACKASCAKESPKAGNVAQFCELYCGCTHDNLEAKVPFNDLRAYTAGKKSESNQAIVEIRDQCIQDAHTATQKSAGKKS